MLLLEGYIESLVGDGTKVARLQPEQLFQHARHVGDQRTTESAETPPVVLAQRAQLLIKAPSSEAFTSLSNTATSVFRIGQPDVASFPYKVWARLVAKHARHSLQAVPWLRASLFSNSNIQQHAKREYSA